jgi:hypothetical protein
MSDAPHYVLRVHGRDRLTLVEYEHAARVILRDHDTVHARVAECLDALRAHEARYRALTSLTPLPDAIRSIG